MVKRVAVIGAGVSGLAAIKWCLEEGLEPVCFEIRDDIGGLWNYKDDVQTGRSTVMKTTVSNTAKGATCYSDFPVPDNFPMYLSHAKFLEYLRLYAENFDLTKHIQFQTEVVSVSKTAEFASTGRWLVEWKHMETGKTRTEEFEGVLVANGHLSKPHIPKFEGQDIYKGTQLHAQQYRRPNSFEGKRVVVVGLCNSGADVATDLAKTCDQVYLSTRRGAWLCPRLLDNGLPLDLFVNTRLNNLIGSCFPNCWNHCLEQKMSERIDHSMYSIRPAHKLIFQQACINDDLPSALASGRVIIKPDIRCMMETGVIFDDDSVVEDIDVIIFATGYYVSFPFLREKDYEVENNATNLYKRVFAPDVDPPTLAIIGCFEPTGPNIPPIEMQCRWAIKVIKGELKLPSKEEMWKDVKLTKDITAMCFSKSMRYSLLCNYIGYMDDIANMLNCKPNIGRLALSDPRLAWALLFHPVTPAQYRLVGPGSWPGARQTVLSTWDNVTSSLKTRKVPERSDEFNVWKPMLSLFVVLFCIFICCYVCI